MEQLIVMGTTGKSNGTAVKLKQFFLLELKIKNQIYMDCKCIF